MILEAWENIQTIEEFLSLARIYGNRLITNLGDYFGEYLIPDSRRLEFLDALKKEGINDASVRAYYDRLQIERQPREPYSKVKRRQDFRKEHPLKSILQDAKQRKGKYPFRYVTFGKYATKKELEKIFEELLQEKEFSVLKRLLWVFRRTPLPEVNDLLIQLAIGKNKPVRSAAIAALSRKKDERVHQLARELVSEKKLTGEYREVLDLFIHNFNSSDSLLILAALQNTRLSIDDIHSLGFSILAVTEKQNSPALTDLLLWVYEKTPCMQCRHSSLEEMNKYHGIPKDIWDEIEFDADESIRDFWKSNRPTKH